MQAYGLNLDKLNLGLDDPIYLSYAADREYTEYFLDQGYDFSLNPNFGVSFKTEKIGMLGLIFGKDNEIIPAEAYYRAPVIVRTFNDIVEIEYGPLKDLEVQEIFYVVSSRLTQRRISLYNTSGRKLSLYILPVFQRLPFEDVRVEDLEDGFTFNLSVPPDSWQRKKLDRYKGEFEAFLMSPDLHQRAVYDGIWGLQALSEKGRPFTTSARRGSLIALGGKIILSAGEKRVLNVFWGKVPDGIPMHGFLNNVKPVSEVELEKVFNSRKELYSSVLSKMRFQDRDQALLGFSSLLLLREQFMQAENRLPYNYYLFSREPTWGWGHAGQVLHESIGTIAYAHLDPQGAMDSQRNYFAMQDEDGYIPYRIGPYLRETIDGETSSAPLLNWENWEIYQITHDRSFLKEAYEHGAKFCEWWKLHRDKDKDGLCEWGGDPILECVRDSHNVIFQEALGSNPKKIYSLEAFDLNCFLVSEAEALSHMAIELGLKDASQKWREEAEARKALINQTFWDPKTSFYYHADLTTNEIRPELKRKEMIAFLALWAHVASESQAKLLVEQLTDPELFWREFGIPGLAANDPYYDPNTGGCKWNGPVWPQWQYLFFEGLLDYGYTDIAKDLLQRLSNAVTHWLAQSHKFWEQYNADSIAEQHSHKDYYWTGIIFEMLQTIYKKDNS